jgi:hypothetical protein
MTTKHVSVAVLLSTGLLVACAASGGDSESDDTGTVGAALKVKQVCAWNGGGGTGSSTSCQETQVFSCSDGTTKSITCTCGNVGVAKGSCACGSLTVPFACTDNTCRPGNAELSRCGLPKIP